MREGNLEIMADHNESEAAMDVMVNVTGDDTGPLESNQRRVNNFGSHESVSAPSVERLFINSFRGHETKGSPIEVRSPQHRSIGGYAAVFNKRSVNLGGFVEVLDPRTFNKSSADGFPGVICRFNHSDDLLLGTTQSGTCRLNVDGSGLLYEVDVPQCRSDVFELTERGDLRHSSFAFQAYEDDWTQDESGYPVRMVLSARLIDVAPVTNPAYPDATVGLRSLARHMDAPYVDVAERAERDELRSFFVRTDNRGAPSPVLSAEINAEAPDEAAINTTFGPSALAEILGKREHDPI